MKQFFRTNISFFIPHILFLIISAFFLIGYSKAEIHIWLNSFNSAFFDDFFRLITELGNGLIYLFVLVLLLLTRSYKWSVMFIVAVVVSNIIVHLFKNVLMPDVYRPSKYFELFETYKLHFVEGVKLRNIHSFPSGHTTTAFTIFFMLAVLTKKHGLKLLCFIVALLTAYSRIYLSQHFLIDVFVGSILGVGSVIFGIWIIERYKKGWMEKRLFRSNK